MFLCFDFPFFFFHNFTISFVVVVGVVVRPYLTVGGVAVPYYREAACFVSAAALPFSFLRLFLLSLSLSLSLPLCLLSVPHVTPRTSVVNCFL